MPLPEPDWNNYTSLFDWFNASLIRFRHEKGYFPNEVILPQERWDKVKKNHFITIPGSNYFFGLEVKIGTPPQVSHTETAQYET